MENTINYNLTHVIDYTPYQLRLPIDLSLVIDKLDPMWSFLEIVNRINLRRFIRSHKGNQGYDPIMMMRVILFAYMNHVYSLRSIEEKCKTDIRLCIFAKMKDHLSWPFKDSYRIKSKATLQIYLQRSCWSSVRR